MSSKVSSTNNRLIKFKSLRVRSSRQVCEERLACRGKKPYAIYTCRQCNSNQCESCEALLHEDFRLTLHERHLILGPPVEDLCEGGCQDRNYADLTCESCRKNFCLVCDHLVHHSKSKHRHKRTKFVNSSEEYLSCDEIPEEYLPFVQNESIEVDSESTDEEELDEMMSLSSHLNDALPDLFPEHEYESLSRRNRSNKDTRSFLLIDDKEELQVRDTEKFIEKLNCGGRPLKVVSIFGNTGDGKSYTLNHTFFDAQEIFETSSSCTNSCTVGVWAAYSPSCNVITIDTEGFLGQASNPNKRARMLLKILAISDVVIYRTRAERLHNDMFSFLGDASAAYTKHFAQELEETLTRCNVEGPLSLLGPSVIIFHETQYTEILAKTSNIEPELIIRARFQELGYKIDAFNSLEYLGLCRNSKKTDFSPLKQRVEKLIQNSVIRVARSPGVVFKVLKILNEKFSGNIDKAIPHTFPDQYFTCSAVCKSCKSRCSNSMNHENDAIPHESSKNCSYQHQFDNRIFLCKICYERGEEVTVFPKYMESNDSSWLGYAKFAWSGYILECAKCGVIYRSRQYWYGNQNPWETCVRTEICHVWPQMETDLSQIQNRGQYVIDNLTAVSEIVSSIGAKPTKFVSSWVADQIAPSYWIPNSQITQCGICKKTFDGLEKKHHCRACGGGFCEECASKTRILPTWGSSPVRVCNNCHDNENSPRKVPNPPDVTARKVSEVLHTTLGTVASAVSLPFGYIKDSARPSYWVPDQDLIMCSVCKFKFGPKLSKHHCRACGEGVCDECSKTKMPVPVHGWTYPVRVCNNCVDKNKEE